MNSIRINSTRLWQSLMAMAKIGATPAGGCNRQALTELDQQGRDLFVQWCKEAGCTIKIDTMGNIFARRAGKSNDKPAVITGSHLDTQPTGGKFDGVYGVLAGLEVIRSLNDAGIETEHPIEVVCWTNEEGARFSPAMIGSGVWTGVFDLEYGHSRTDKEGVSIKSALEQIGYLGDNPAQHQPIKAAFELHIEQGPILEAEEKQIGIVSGVQGMNWYDVTLKGKACHAGPTPMDVRKDSVQGAAAIINELYQLIDAHAPWSRVTFGDIAVSPGSRNTMPETLVLAVDLRHPDQAVLDSMEDAFKAIVATTAEKFGLSAEVHEEWKSPAVSFDKNCIEAVRQSTHDLGYTCKEMFSGAGHDAVYLSRVAPTSMIFIPCEDGLSHNEAENTTIEETEAGCNVLLHAMLISAEAIPD